MHGPPLVGWLLVALAGATGLYCLARMRSGCPEERRAAGAEALMGMGMAAMAVPPLALGIPPYGPAAFAAVFGIAAVRSAALACRTGHRAHHAHHAVAAAAMVYMALAMSAAPGGPGGPGVTAARGWHLAHHASGVPAVTGALLAYFALYALWAGTRLVPAAAGAGTAGAGTAPVAAVPELATACRVSMGIGMFAMLLAM